MGTFFSLVAIKGKVPVRQAYLEAQLLAKLVAQPVFLADRTFGILLGRNVTTTVTFIVPEVLGPLCGLWYFKPEFHFIVSFEGSIITKQLLCQYF